MWCTNKCIYKLFFAFLKKITRIFYDSLKIKILEILIKKYKIWFKIILHD